MRGLVTYSLSYAVKVRYDLVYIMCKVRDGVSI